MSRRSDGLTGTLFDPIPQAATIACGSMDLRRRYASMAADAIAAYRGKDNDNSKRYYIASRMSELADVETSKGLIDSYTAVSREECNLPAWKTLSFEVATNSRIFTEFQVAFHGGKILWGAEVMDAELGKVQRQIDELRAQEKVLRKARGRLR